MPGLPDSNWCAATSANGASLMLPYRPDNNGGYNIEYIMFGGQTSRDGYYNDPQTGERTNAITSEYARWLAASLPCSLHRADTAATTT